MSDIHEPFDDGATPLGADERAGLKPTWVATRDDLNRAEGDNVAAGALWGHRRLQRVDLLSEKFCRELHRRMFGDVWRWAGEFRQSVLNIGVEPYAVAVELRTALDDARFWFANDEWPVDEAAARFHHRLVWIHPFPNGNGRWSRLMADLSLEKAGAEPFSWGSADLARSGDARERYIGALHAADAHDFAPLFDFVRS